MDFDLLQLHSSWDLQSAMALGGPVFTSDILAAMNIKVNIFRDVKPYSLVHVQQYTFKH
jgi:hypothetical protein